MAFPTTPILDDFNRADEGPPPSASWSNISGLPGYSAVVSSNLLVKENDLNEGDVYWNTPFNADCEVYITTTTNTGDFGFILFARHEDFGAGQLGYDAYFGYGAVKIELRENSPPYITTLANFPVVVTSGDQIGMSIIGDEISVYLNGALIGSVNDSTISSGGYIGLSIDPGGGEVGIELDDFGGGNYSGATPPVADFSGTPLTGAAPLSVDFTDSSTNTPTSWLWDFGDGGGSTDQNPTHEYDTPGTYTVELTATNGDGSDTETKVGYVVVSGAPTAEFSGTPTSGTVSLSVDFTDLSTDFPSSWFWDFGDGGYSTSQNPTHVYSYIGLYTVTLIATNSYGSDSETKVDYISVTAVSETGPAVVENCDINTGGASVGLRIQDVAIARDNILGSLTIDASAELRAKDNSYSTLVNNGTLTSLAGDRAVWDTDNFAASHAKDIDDGTGQYHLVSAATQTYTITNPSTDRAYNVTATSLNELAAIVGTLISDLQAKGLLS